MIEVNRRNFAKRWHCYLLLALPLLLVLTFNYFPIVNGVIHMFFRWDGDKVEEYTGVQNFVHMVYDTELWRTFGVVLVFMAANLIKMIPAIVAAMIIHRIFSSRMQYVYRVLFTVPMIIPAVVFILLWKYFYEPNNGAFNEILRFIGVLGPTESMQWLSDKRLVLPSLIFSGFPWVGTFGVLIYLAGLGNIGKELYEAADLDGAGPLRVFWDLELPLIATQIKINLVLTTISTLQGWQFVYLFLGESGGPDGIATVPGLLIFRDAFSKGFFGYGCAVGFVLFLLTLLLTWISSRFTRVDK